MLTMIIFVLALFKFPATLNSFTRFPSETNFIFATVSYCSSSSCSCSLAAASTSSCCPLASFSSSSASFYTMSFNLSRPYPIFSIILLYNKEADLPMLCSRSASASRVSATGTDTALYNLEVVFLKNVLILYYIFLRNFLKILWAEKMIKKNFL